MILTTLRIVVPQHVWIAGAAGLMKLAVMTRATLGHTVQDLLAGPVTLATYVSLIASILPLVVPPI